MPRHLPLLIALGFVLASLPLRASEPGERFVSLRTPRGVSQPIYLTIPPGAPRGIAVLFPGGNGVLELTAQGISRGLDNFVVRTRQLYARAGILTCLVDVPSDHPDGIGDYRLSASEAEDMSAVLGWLRARWPVPIWAVGTSRGSISAANIAARLRASGPKALVLSASVTAGDSQTLYGVSLKTISVPSLLLHHRSDECASSPPDGLQPLSRAFPTAPAILFLQGGLTPQSDPCGGLSHHGFYGLEETAVAKTIEFLRTGKL